jgi:hypothetical protein
MSYFVYTIYIALANFSYLLWQSVELLEEYAFYAHGIPLATALI